MVKLTPVGRGIPTPQVEEAAEVVTAINLIDDIPFAGKVAESAKLVWKDPSIQKAYERSAEFQLNDTAQ